MKEGRLCETTKPCFLIQSAEIALFMNNNHNVSRLPHDVDYIEVPTGSLVLHLVTKGFQATHKVVYNDSIGWLVGDEYLLTPPR